MLWLWHPPSVFRGEHRPCGVMDIPSCTTFQLKHRSQMFHVEHRLDREKSAGLPEPLRSFRLTVIKCSTWNIPNEPWATPWINGATYQVSPPAFATVRTIAGPP